MSPSRIYQAHGIVLKRRSHGETDRVLTVFTKEYGKLTVIAKGIRKITSKRASHLELFTHVRLFLHRGNVWDSISDVNAIHRFISFRRSLAHVSLVYYLCDLVDKLLPSHQEHSDVYEYLLETLRGIGSSPASGLPQLQYAFSVAILTKLGYLSSHRAPPQDIQQFIEEILERPMRSYAFLTRYRALV